jgi:hypothetical protein
VPPASHPWRVARDDQEELQPEPHIPDLILRELGIWGRVDHG